MSYDLFDTRSISCTNVIHEHVFECMHNGLPDRKLNPIRDITVNRYGKDTNDARSSFCNTISYTWLVVDPFR